MKQTRISQSETFANNFACSVLLAVQLKETQSMAILDRTLTLDQIATLLLSVTTNTIEA